MRMDFKGEQRKALELLKSLKLYFGSKQVLLQTQIDEAIAELEELMKPKSCSTCKHGTMYMGTDRKWCEASIKQDGMTTVDKDFCCNRYEPKDEA